jgi:L-ribulose-5-phosphate 3-epimerase
MAQIGIMQGRMVPPENDQIQSFPRMRWRDEFALAAEAGLDCIEWIYDVYGAQSNPLMTDDGIDEMWGLSSDAGVRVYSICADYFMDKPLVRASKVEVGDRLSMLFRLMRRGQLLGVNRIVLPFVDASRIESDRDFEDAVSALNTALPVADETGVEIHLETSLSPSRFAKLLDRVQDPMVKANYDSGNSASLGYNVHEEFSAYGGRIGSVHIKDRVYGAGSVPLGTGDVDFRGLFECLQEIRYEGDYILQVARDEPGDEVAWARQNREFVEGYLSYVTME